MLSGNIDIILFLVVLWLQSDLRQPVRQCERRLASALLRAAGGKHAELIVPEHILLPQEEQNLSAHSGSELQWAFAE